MAEPDNQDEAIRAFAEWQIELWGLVRAELESRPGWHFEVEEETGFPYWRFGEAGRARLVLTVRYDMFLIYDADRDVGHPMLASGDSLKVWLDKHESEHAELTEAQVKLGSYMIPNQIEKWLQGSKD